jgi:hypothetical protein
MKPLMIVSILMLCACNHKDAGQHGFDVSMVPVARETVFNEPAMEIANDKPPAENEIDGERSGDLIMKRADVKFEVENVETNTKSIEKLVSAHNAIIARENLSTATAQISNEITIRVPSSAFEALLNDLSKESKFMDFKRVMSENVTEEYEDIQTRLKTKREVRDRYTEILKTKARTVEDILKAEEHIRVLQEEIEAKEARLNFLKSRISMSEINLEIYQKVIYKEAPALIEKPYVAKVLEALKNGWSFVTSLSLLIVNSWPVLIIASLIYWGWRRRKQKLLVEG